jgi:hypothetical protein
MPAYRLTIHTNGDVKMFNKDAFVFEGLGFDKHVRYDMIQTLAKVSLEPFDRRLEACQALRKAVADMIRDLQNWEAEDDLFTLLKHGSRQQYVEVEACWEIDGKLF